MAQVRLLVSGFVDEPNGLVALVGGTEVSRHRTNDPYGGYTTIIVDMPSAPDDAVAMTPHFTRHNDGRVALSAIEYETPHGYVTQRFAAA
jgi:hypothetical protein